MKSLKKLSSLLALCMVCVLVFAACGPKGGGNGQKDEPTEAQTEELTTEEVTTEEATTKEATPADKTSVKGTVSGTTYTSTYMNLKFEAPGTWAFYGDDELASQSGVSVSDYTNNFASLADSNQLYDMFAQRSDGTNISIIVQSGAGMSASILKQAVEAAAPSVEDALSEQGATDISWKMSDMDFPLKDYVVLDVSSKLSGFDIFQRQVYALVDDYAYIITLTCINTDESNEIFGYFSKIK